VKARKLSAIAVAAARLVLTEAAVACPSDIQVEALAQRHGALVLHRRLTTAQATIVRAGKHAVICVDERSRGTARERFTIAHELGHHLLHKVSDHFKQCEAGAERRDNRAYWIEREADEFTTELLMPEVLASPMCAAPLPTLDDVERLSRTFRTSFEASGIRFAQLAKGPCAFVRTMNGHIKWATESATFPGKIVKGRAVPLGSAAASAMGRAGGLSREVPGHVWGARDGTLVEDALSLGPGRGTLSWVLAL